MIRSFQALSGGSAPIPADNNTDSTSTGHAEVKEADGFIVFLLMLVLLFGALFDRLKPVLPIPFTLLMLLLGMAMGGIAFVWPFFREQLGPILTISPHLIFHLFLPPLIFEGAKSLKVTILSEVRWQAFILAVPGVIIHTAFVTVFVKLALYDSWSWPGAMLLGALLSATDPVAVVATLKDLDADIGITVLTDGEAILNDGTSIVLFSVLFSAAQIHGSIDPNGEFFGLIINLIVTPLPLGILLGHIMFRILKVSRGFPVVQAIVQVSGAYVSFYVSDSLCRTSGVLTLMAMAVHLSNQRGRLPKIAEEEEMVHSFWEVIVWIANALIFWMVGALIAYQAIPAASGLDWGALFAIYAFLHVSRAMMIGMCYPVLNCFSLQITKARFLMLVHGALRGAVALAMALAVFVDNDMPEAFQHSVLFLTSGIVFLTITINGSTAKFVVEKLKMNLKPEYAVYAFKNAQKELAAMLEVGIENEAKACRPYLLNWPIFRRLTLINFNEEYQTLTRTKGGDEEVVLPTLLRAMKKRLWQDRDAGYVSGKCFSIMVAALNDQITSNKFYTAKEFEQMVMDEARPDWVEEIQMRCLNNPSRNSMDQIEAVAVEAMLEFYYLLDGAHRTLMFLHSQTRSLFGLRRKLKDIRRGAYEILQQLQSNPIAKNVVAKRQALTLLSSARRSIDEISEMTGLSSHQDHTLKHHLSELLQKAGDWDPTEALESAEDFVLTSELFSNVDWKAVDEFAKKENEARPDSKEKTPNAQEVKREIINLLKACTVSPEQDEKGVPIPIELNGELGILHAGKVEKRVSNRVDFVYWPGQFFGFVSGKDSQQKKYYPKDLDVQYYSMKGEELQALMRRNVALRQGIWKTVGIGYAASVLGECYPTCHLEMYERKSVANNGNLLIVDDKEQDYFVRPEDTMLLLCGVDTKTNISAKSTHLCPRSARGTLSIGSVALILQGVPVMRHDIYVTGIPFVDAAHIKLNVALTSFLRAQDDGEDRLFQVLAVLVDQLPVLGAVHILLREHHLQDRLEKTMKNIAMFCRNCRRWITRNSFGEILDHDEVICGVEKHFLTFVSKPQEAWAEMLVARIGPSKVKDFTYIFDVITVEQLDAFYSEEVGLDASQIEVSSEDESNEPFMEGSTEFPEQLSFKRRVSDYQLKKGALSAKTPYSSTPHRGPKLTPLHSEASRARRQHTQISPKPSTARSREGGKLVRCPSIGTLARRQWAENIDDSPLPATRVGFAENNPTTSFVKVTAQTDDFDE